jgi:hypothetical protein
VRGVRDRIERMRERDGRGGRGRGSMEGRNGIGIS